METEVVQEEVVEVVQKQVARDNRRAQAMGRAQEGVGVEEEEQALP